MSVVRVQASVLFSQRGESRLVVYLGVMPGISRGEPGLLVNGKKEAGKVGTLPGPGSAVADR